MQILLTSIGNEFGDANKTMVSQTLVVVNPDQVLTVGRSPDCDYCIAQDPRLSSQHLQIANREGRAILRDLNSTNGTFVNGRQVGTVTLQAGDQIQAGRSYFKIGLVDEHGSDQSGSPMESISFEAAADPDVGVRIADEELAAEHPAMRRLQVAIEIPQGDGRGLSNQSLSQYLPIIEAGELQVFGRNSVGVDRMIRQDGQMSASHFEVSNDGDAAWLRDLNSTNGLFLNGVQIAKARLRDADVILAGETSFKVHLYGGPPIGDADEMPIERVEAQAAAAPAVTVKSTPFQAPRIVNATPFPLSMLKGRVNYPGYSLTLIVKATMELKPDGAMTIADEQCLPSGDCFSEGEFGHPILGYPTDFAFFKPQADVLFRGACYAPGGQPTGRCRAHLSIGNLQREIDVFGDRVWSSRLTGSISDPVPFTRMPITYERTYGGPKFSPNPIGRGIARTDQASGDREFPLPNLIDPSDQLRGDSGTFKPTSFGPLDSQWEARVRQLGSFDDRWQASRIDWFPENLEWSYFNSAPEGQRLAGYLAGDERLKLLNLNPHHATLQTQLPGIRIKCFVSEADDPLNATPAAARFREVSMNLDTLWIDGDASRAVLIWRGNLAVSHTYHPEIKQIFVMQEDLKTEASAAGYYWRPFVDTIKREDAEWEIEPESNEPTPQLETVVEQQPIVSDPFTKLDPRTPEEKLAALDSVSHQLLLDAGLDPENPPPLSDEDEQTKQQILDDWGLGDVAGDEPDEELENDAGDVGKQKRQLLKDYLREGKSLDGVDLSEADLSRLNLVGISFVGTDFSNANLRKADLSGANLSEAILVEADLSEAKLTDANLNATICQRANFLSSDLRGCSLEEADFSSATLQSADLTRCQASHSLMIEANLSQTRFDEADLSDATLDQARLNQASFSNSNLEGASLAEAVGARCNFSQASLHKSVLRKAELTAANFEQIRAVDSVWTEATLTASRFVKATLDEADFGGAQLDQTNLEWTIAKEARFAFCSMKQSNAVRANLFRANCEGSDLTQADISCSNFYGVELLDATLDQTRCESTNLKATRLFGASKG